MKFFTTYDTMYYSLDNNLQEFKVVTDIFTKINFIREVLDNRDLYYEYEMKDEDTPEIIAHKLYGSVDRHWIILMLNQITDPFYELPMKYDSFNQYIITKYGSIESAMTTLDHYEKKVTITTNKNGYITSNVHTTALSTKQYDFATNSIVDLSASLPTISVPSIVISNDTSVIEDTDGIDVYIQKVVEYIWISQLDNEINLNEAKRNIRLIRPEFISTIEQQFRELMS